MPHIDYLLKLVLATVRSSPVVLAVNVASFEVAVLHRACATCALRPFAHRCFMGVVTVAVCLSNSR